MWVQVPVQMKRMNAEIPSVCLHGFWNFKHFAFEFIDDPILFQKRWGWAASRGEADLPAMVHPRMA
jgi:hypothetical protein